MIESRMHPPPVLRKPPRNTSEPLLNMKETATFLHCSYTTVRRLVISGQLPVVRITNRWMFRPSDLHDYVERHCGGLAR